MRPSLSVLVFFISIFFLSSCAENTQNTSKRSQIDYFEFGSAYLIGKDIYLWSVIPEAATKAAQSSLNETKQPLEIIDATAPIKVTVLNIELDDLLVISKNNAEWVRIRFGQDEDLKEGFVNYENVYSDRSAKILYAIYDDVDDRIRIKPRNFSTGSELNLSKQHAPQKKLNKISKKHCDLFDAALIMSSIDSQKKGEFETTQEFIDRKDSIRKLSLSTGAQEKIYAYSVSILTKTFKYDVDTETMSFDLLELGSRFTCPERYCYSSDSWKNLSTLSEVSYVPGAYSSYGKVSGQDFCSRARLPVTKFTLGNKIPSLGRFDLNFNDDKYGDNGKYVITERFKIDRDSARLLKETEGLSFKYIIGFSVDGEVFKGKHWTSRECSGSYPNEYCYDRERDDYTFSSNVEYLMLFDHEGNLLKSYFSSNYIDNFLQNDLLIQKHAYANANILKDIDSLEEKEQLAKLFFNRTNL